MLQEYCSAHVHTGMPAVAIKLSQLFTMVPSELIQTMEGLPWTSDAENFLGK